MSKQGWRQGLRLGSRQLWRDLRAGELRLLVGSVALAVAALAAVGFLADRLQAGLWRDARQLLGGDAVVVSDKPTPERLRQEALRRGLVTNTNVVFPTMARVAQANGAGRLVALKAVAPGYPLRGALQIRRQFDAAQDMIPGKGQVWVDAALLDSLGLVSGQTLALGERQFRITGVIEHEPDRGPGFMSFAPRVMMNVDDLASTALVQPASRVTWRMAVAGPPGLADPYALWAKEKIETENLRGVQVESLESGRPEMRQTLERASQFLNLVALLAALLCAVSVALAARSFAALRLDACALLRVLGQSQRTLALAYATEFLGAGLLAGAMGVAMGYGVHMGLMGVLQSLIDTQLPAPSLLPGVVSMGLGLTLLAAFGLPPVLQLAQVPALRVLRRELGALQWRSGLVLVMGMMGAGLMLVVVSRDLRMGVITVLGFTLALLFFAGLTGLSLWALRQWSSLGTQGPRWWRLAARQLAARPMASVVQVSALSVGLLALVLLVLLRTDLVTSWRQSIPENAPDRFVINVQPEQAQDFLAYLREAGVRSPDWYPMVRGRLVAINAREVRVSDYGDERARRLVDREFNLSYSARQPAHNTLVAGVWRDGEAGGVSVEQGIAETLGLQLGDVLRFDMGGIAHEARISSLRKVDWTSMRANFFVLFPLDEMPELPTTWLAAFRTPEGHRNFERTMLQRFPNVTSVDMRSSLAQVQRVLDQVTQAVEYLFAFTLAAGVLVLMAAMSAGRQARERDYAIMRALGAGRILLTQMQRAELLSLGCFAGVMASSMALVLGWVLTHYVLAFAWTPLWWVPLVGGVLGALLAWGAGSLSLRGVLREPVAQSLRRSTE